MAVFIGHDFALASADKPVRSCAAAPCRCRPAMLMLPGRECSLSPHSNACHGSHCVRIVVREVHALHSITVYRCIRTLTDCKRLLPAESLKRTARDRMLDTRAHEEHDKACSSSNYQFYSTQVPSCCFSRASNSRYSVEQYGNHRSTQQKGSLLCRIYLSFRHVCTVQDLLSEEVRLNVLVVPGNPSWWTDWTSSLGTTQPSRIDT